MNLTDSVVEEHEISMTTNIACRAGLVTGSCAMRLFPVKHKRPLISGWQNVGTFNMAQMEAWTEQFPGCGWGAAIDDDTMVIDCDSEAAVSALYDLGEAYGGVPATLTTFTPRGFHFWFCMPEGIVRIRNRVGVMPGIDVRAKGGFVVVPPSDGYEFADPSVPVAEVPEWLLQLVTGDSIRVPSPKAVNDQPTPTPFEKDVADRVWEKRIAPGKVPEGRSPFSLRIALEPQTVGKGMRNAALYAYLCRLRGEGKPEATIRDEAWRVVSQIPEPLSKFEVERIIANAMKFDASPTGNNALVKAWRTVEQIEAALGTSKWYRFLLLVEQLEELRPETRRTILLPVRSIGILMNAHYTQVGKWRRRAMKMGILSQTSRYVRRRLADEFAVKAGFSPLAEGPDVYKVKRGRKPRQPVEKAHAA